MFQPPSLGVSDVLGSTERRFFHSTDEPGSWRCGLRCGGGEGPAPCLTRKAGEQFPLKTILLVKVQTTKVTEDIYLTSGGEWEV